MLPNIPISRLQLTYKALAPLQLPAMPGVLWHSVFGRALHDQSCSMPNQPCETCLLLHQCDYPYLFSRIAPPNAEMMHGNKIPIPHVFRFLHEQQKTLQTGDTFDVELILIGQASEKLPVVLRAMLMAGLAGLGKQRSRVQLQQVQQIRADGSPLDIIQHDQIIAQLEAGQPPSTEMPEQLTVSFITPYKPTGKKSASELDVAFLLMAIIRRISLLQYFYTGQRLTVDFRQLKAHTEAVSVLTRQLHWQASQRYSASHSESIDTSGWLGMLELDMKGAEILWPYIQLGQWLNVGKNASMGFGRYEVV